jgi:hypothetical protein
MADGPHQHLKEQLTDLPPLKCAEIRNWLMERFELSSEALMDFANGVHLVFEQEIRCDRTNNGNPSVHTCNPEASKKSSVEYQ